MRPHGAGTVTRPNTSAGRWRVATRILKQTQGCDKLTVGELATRASISQETAARYLGILSDIECVTYDHDIHAYTWVDGAECTVDQLVRLRWA